MRYFHVTSAVGGGAGGDVSKYFRVCRCTTARCVVLSKCAIVEAETWAKRRDACGSVVAICDLLNGFNE